jgi:nitrite reductase/ring-hydroxylating ferredoxin subunit
VTGSAVVCPLHGWKANLETGAIERPAQGRGRCVETYPTQVVNGIVVVGVPENRGRE